MSTKSFRRVRVKDATLGIVEAVFASNLVDDVKMATVADIDHDGDITLKGAFTSGQPVVISAFGHGSWEGRLPVGKGIIREEGSEAICEMQFLMDTPHGSDTFKTVAALSEDDLQEWSYSLHDVTASRAQVGGKSVRVLERVALVKEVSPVLMGAGVATRTRDVKERKQLDSSVRSLLRAAGRQRWTGWVYLEDYDLDEGYAVFGVESYAPPHGESLYRVEFTRTDTSVTLGDTEVEVHESAVYLPKQARNLQFSEHIGAVVADVDALAARASEVVALRAEKGKSISEANAAQLRHLVASVEALKAYAGDGPASNDNQPADDLQAEFLRFVATTAQGVHS